VVARDAPEPTKSEFQRVTREVALGLSSQEALQNLVRRINSEDFDLVVTAIAVQHEVGGNLAQILDTIGHTIRERIRIKGEIRVLTAQQQLSGYVISLLPVVLGFIIYMMNPNYMSGLFTPGIYMAMPICAGLGIVLGFVIMKKITDIEV
jgi:tight adherence protein B